MSPSKQRIVDVTVSANHTGVVCLHVVTYEINPAAITEHK
jgi:hypothetical protein